LIFPEERDLHNAAKITSINKTINRHCLEREFAYFVFASIRYSGNFD
jgi:hypothetical protein